jgi:septin family protein
LSLDLLDRAIAEARRLDRPDLVDRLGHERERVLRPVCQLLVIGEFKKGKSALINALINARVCPVDADVATAVPTTVRYGSQLAATLVTHGTGPGGETVQAREPIPRSSIRSLVVDRAGRQEPSQPAQSVEIEVPRELLRQGLVLFDTPGVGGGLAAAHAAATLRALSLADALVFVSDASQEYTAPELEFLRQAAAMCPEVVCVLTKIDFYPEWRRILELDRGHLLRAGLDYELLPLSAPLRHHALRTRDRALDRESGFPALSAYLRSHVLARKEALVTRSATAAVRSSLEQMVSRVAAVQATLADPALLERLEDAQQRAERLRGAASGWQQTLNDRFADMISNVDMDLAVRLRAIRQGAVARIEGGDPAKLWGELQGWLHERTNEELAAHYRQIQDQADAVAQEVARHFDAAADGLALGLEVGGPEAAHDSPPAEFRFERLSRMELGMLAMRGTSSSVTIAGMVGTFMAFAAPVLLPAAAVLAFTVTRTTLRQAREAHLRANRAAATRAVHTYLEETELVARKSSRDMLRRVNRRLRDFFAARVEELHTTANQNLEAAAGAIKADRESRKERLEQLGADLRRLQQLIEATNAALRAATAGDGATR